MLVGDVDAVVNSRVEEAHCDVQVEWESVETRGDMSIEA